MSALIVATLLLAPPGPPPTDTVVELRRGDRVVVENFSGDVLVVGWDRPELRVLGRDDDDVDVGVERSGSRVALVSGRRGWGREIDAELRVPRWAGVEIRGRDLDVVVRGVEAAVSIRNVEGDILVEGPASAVEAFSVQDEVRVRGARGPVRAASQGDDVTVEDVQGEVDAESGDGDVYLLDVDGTVVRGETMDGDVAFRGAILPAGSYRFGTHDGDAVIDIPRDTGARVSVATFDGEFQSDFPVRVERFSGGRAFNFTLGDGRARIEIEVFDGEILLRERR